MILDSQVVFLRFAPNMHITSLVAGSLQKQVGTQLHGPSGFYAIFQWSFIVWLMCEVNKAVGSFLESLYC